MRSASSDIQWTLKDIISEGDKIAAWFTMRGTHQGGVGGISYVEKHRS